MGEHTMTTKPIQEWLDKNPSAKYVTLFIVDFNGVFRGKRVQRRYIEKAMKGSIKIPFAILGVDIFGTDCVGSGQIFETGDKDGFAVPASGRVLPAEWQDRPTALIPATLFQSPQTPYPADPRQILTSIVHKYHQRGWYPVCAVELEFSLYKLNEGTATPTPAITNLGQSNALYSLNELESYSSLIDDIYTACEACGIESDGAVKEAGAGQFEINLVHASDPVRVADDAHYFKHLVREVAKKHDLGATFMAKPFGDDAGNGFHVHMSLADDNGRNVFDNGGEDGSALLGSAVAGLLTTMRENTLIFAPHYNSYKRFQAETHAPMQLTWGYDNRTTAIRIPACDRKDLRVDLRGAGADANPYLVMSAVLSGALAGIEQQAEPPQPIVGNAYAEQGETVATSWIEAIDLFSRNHAVKEVFGPLFHKMFLACKRQEFEKFANVISQYEYSSYLEMV